MPVPSSGPVSLSNLRTEFGGSTPVSLSQFYRNGGRVTGNNSNVPTSGQIRFSQFRGAVKQFAFTNSTNRSSPTDLRTLLLDNGWNGTDNVLFTNNAILSSNTTGAAALTISGSFPNGVAVVNNSIIVGMGGAGGNTLENGYPGGPAVSVGSAVSITNNGTFAGGGGGGGAGVYWAWNGLNRSTPGSAGASGFTPASGGGGGPNIGGASSQGPDGNGLYSGAGPSQNWGWGGRLSSPGGNGGSWGVAGDAGGTVDGAYNYSGYAGGAGGAALTGTGFVTWVATGTRLGAVV